MKTLDDFLPFLMPLVPGCPDPLARQALIQAAVEFCSRTQLVQGTTVTALREGRAVYDVDIPAQHELVNVLEVFCGSRELDAVSWPAAELPPGRPLWVMKPLPEQSELTVLPTPDAASAGAQLLVRAAYRPTTKATALATELFNNWHDAVVQGAVKRLCAMPSQSFSAAGAVVMAATAFADYVNEARLVARKKRLVQSGRVRPNPFA